MRSPFRPLKVPDPSILDDHRPLVRQIERRGLLRGGLTLGALNRAIARRCPKRGLIFHSDRGIEYTHFAYQERLAAVGIRQSTKRPTGFGDNAAMESFFHSEASSLIRAT